MPLRQRNDLTVVQREGAEPSKDGRTLERRYPRWFIVDGAGHVVAPGGGGYRNEAVACEALNAYQASAESGTGAK